MVASNVEKSAKELTKEERKAKRAARNAKKNTKNAPNQIGNITIIFVDRMMLKPHRVIETYGHFNYQNDYWMNVFND